MNSTPPLLFGRLSVSHIQIRKPPKSQGEQRVIGCCKTKHMFCIINKYQTIHAHYTDKT